MGLSAAVGLGCLRFVEEERDAGKIHGRADSMAYLGGYLADGGAVAASFGAAAAAFAGSPGAVEAAIFNASGVIQSRNGPLRDHIFRSAIVTGPNEGRRAQLVLGVFPRQSFAWTSYPAEGARKLGRWTRWRGRG